MREELGDRSNTKEETRGVGAGPAEGLKGFFFFFSPSSLPLKLGKIL